MCSLCHRVIHGIFVTTLLSTYLPTANAEIYKYVDKHGRVILTEKPSSTGYKRLVKTWTGWNSSEAQLSSRISSLRREIDSLDLITWLYDANAPHEEYKNYVYAYIGTKSGETPWLRLRLQYHRLSWLMIDGYTFYVDGEKFEGEPVTFARDETILTQYEWADFEPSSKDLNALKKIALSKRAFVRYWNEHYHDDRQITEAEKTGIGNILAVFEALKASKTWKNWNEAKGAHALKDFDKNQSKFTPLVRDAAKRYELPVSLLYAVVTAESAFDSEATYGSGAAGLMGLMPETAKRYGVTNRRNPVDNVNGGTRYLRDLLVMFNNNLQLALAAYNVGEDVVKKNDNKIPPYPETQMYVQHVVEHYMKYRKSMTKSEEQK